MTEIIKTDKQPNEIAIEINAIKRKTAQDVIQSAIEIGRLLCEAKAQLEHGQWGAWLEENVSYSTTNANNMMRLYKEYRKQDQIDFFGDNGVDIFEGLNLSQAIALLGLPQSERREFVETHDMQEMSVRDIQSAIKEKQEAEKRAEDAENRAFEAERKADKLEEQLSEAEDTAKGLREELGELLAKPAPTLSEAEINQIKKEADDAAEAKAKKKIDDLKKSLENEKKKTATASENAKKDAEKAFEEERKKIIEERKKQAEADAQKKIDALEAKLKEAQIAASPHLSTLKVLMGELQDVYRKMIATVEAAEAEDQQQGASLRAAMMKLVEAMAAQVKAERG